MALPQLAATLRTETGKGYNRRLRMENKLPCVFYDQKGTNISVTVELMPLMKLYKQVKGSQLFDLMIDGKAYPSLMWRRKLEPVKLTPMHVDFFGVDLEKTLKVKVPYVVNGDSPGVKLGGRLEQYREFIEIVCKPADIPLSVELNIDGMKIMETIRIADVVFPEGVKPVYDENYAVLAILAKRGADTSEEGEEEAE